MRLASTSILLLVSLSACAFFNEPIDGLGTPTTSVPATGVPSSLPPPATTANVPAPVQPSVTQTATAQQTERVPAASQSANASNSASGTYFTVATLFDIPENSNNISFVHLTSTGGSTRRELAMCRALLERFPVTEPALVPANAANLIVWPVRNEATGGTCLEMLTDYEPIDISNETAEKVNSQADGPFMLTRNTPLDKRMIYDLSFVRPRALPAAVGEWQLFMGSAASDWPTYRAAR